MAARRITQSSINWAKLSERVPETQRSNFLTFKSKSDGYLRRVLAQPENPPAIDWNVYKAKIPISGLVDTFKKEYEALKIPYPPNTLTEQLNSQEKEIKADIEKYKVDSNARIAKYKKELAHLESLLSFDQMTLEDFKDAYPDIALDPVNRPTFWPHTPEEQPGYVDEQQPVAEKH